MDVNLKNLTLFVSLWGWQILAIIFFCSSILVIGLPNKQLSIVFAGVFFILFAVCEYLSFKRRSDFFHEIEN